MNESISQYLEHAKYTFCDFINHEIIRCNPFSLTDEEVWRGIKGRSNNRPHNDCDFINRMNRYCTSVAIVGHRRIPTNYNMADYGILKYTYNETSSFEILYSTFRYPHVFSDEGMMRDSFEHSGNIFLPSIDLIKGGKREKCVVEPKDIFEVSGNIGGSLFLEYSIHGVNKFQSIKELPSFVNMDATDSFFIEEVRKSLLKTKVVLLSLVDKFPTHLMHLTSFDVLKDSKAIKIEFLSLFEKEISIVIRQILFESNQELFRRGISLNVPF